jgi:hypothetical protein
MQIRDPPKKLRKWRKNIASHHIGIGPVGVDNWFFKGPADLYRGVVGAFLGTVPNALLYFGAYESKYMTQLFAYLQKIAFAGFEFCSLFLYLLKCFSLVVRETEISEAGNCDVQHRSRIWRSIYHLE